MTARVAGIVSAVVVTVIFVLGVLVLIALDFVSVEKLAKLWDNIRTAQRSEANQAELKKARDFTFFTSVPVKEHGFEITTGVSFATLADLNAGRQKDRWCYVQLQPKGGVPRSITLAKQSGSDAPVFNDLSAYPEAELRALGVSAATLESLAREHCRVCCAEGKTA